MEIKSRMIKRVTAPLILFLTFLIGLNQLGAAVAVFDPQFGSNGNHRTLFDAALSVPQYGTDGNKQCEPDGNKQCASNGNKEELSIKEVDRVYLSYYEDFNNLDIATDKLNKILEQNPNNVEALILLSRVWLTYGDVVAKDKNGKLSAYEKGRDVAKKAMELVPRNPDAHFWYTANMGRWGQTKGVLKSLFLVSQIKEQLNLILDLNPEYVPALDVYGVLYYELPGFFGGNLEISEKYLRRAIQLDPHLTLLRVDLARVLIKRKQYEEARSELKKVLGEKGPRLYADWYVKDRKDAEELIAEIKEKK